MRVRVVATMILALVSACLTSCAHGDGAHPIESEDPLSYVGQVARGLRLDDAVVVVGPIRSGDEVVTSGTIVAISARLQAELARAGHRVLASDKLADILLQVGENATALFTSNGRSRLGTFIPADILILGTLHGSVLTLEAIDIKTAIIRDSAIVSVASLHPSPERFFAMLESVPLYERDEVLIEFLRQNPGVVNQSQFERMLGLCQLYERTEVVNRAARYVRPAVD